ncbi:MAG: hypothetical protein J7M34_12155 [Anaerolineae bacterium]|nr:hypothetical protein [Anaerolineae bacterium]
MTRIYTIFTSSGLMGECQIFTKYHPDREVLTNERIMAELKARCDGVEFVGRTEPIGWDEVGFVLANLKGQKGDLDGILIFGNPMGEGLAPFGRSSQALLSIDLPIVAVYPLWGQWMHSFRAYKEGKIVTSILPIIPDNDAATFAARLDDIAGKIKLIDALAKMKGLRVLVVTDRPVLGEYEPNAIQTEPDREQYEEVYLRNLEDVFQTRLVVVSQREMVDRMKAANEKEAREVARMWIDEAAGMRGTNEAEVVKSAKLYLAMKELMAIHDCQAITTEGYTVFQYYKDGPIPSQGLPASQLYTEGIVATSETLIDSLITQQLGLFITGSTGFNGDYLMDTFTNIAIIGHCECPFNPWGDDRRVPYVIRNLPLWEENKGGACVQVNLPVGETVTVVKFSVHDRKMVIFSGETVSGEELFAGWDDILCRTKLAVKTDVKALFDNLDWKTFGNHRVAFYGDHRQRFIDLAALTGVDVVEADRV